MLFLTGEEIDRLIKEDVPYIDLTSWSLGINNTPGTISYFTREDAVVCGTEEVMQIFDRLHIQGKDFIPSGQKVHAQDVLISGVGRSQDLHMAWKVSQNILDHCSGIATKTQKMVERVKKHNPNLSIFTTRKIFPGTKALAVKSIMAGGAIPHRLGISETILIFKQHMNFIGGLEGLLEKLPQMKMECCEKKIIVEATSLEQAVRLCDAGADGIQFDKLPLPQLREAADTLKRQFPSVVVLAAGGINESNIEDYAKLNINGIVMTGLYEAKAIDIGVKIESNDQTV